MTFPSILPYNLLFPVLFYSLFTVIVIIIFIIYIAYVNGLATDTVVLIGIMDTGIVGNLSTDTINALKSFERTKIYLFHLNPLIYL